MSETNGNGKLRIDPGFALQIIVYVVGLAMAYGAISSRVAVVETKQEHQQDRMERMESKIDQLLQFASNGR